MSRQCRPVASVWTISCRSSLPKRRAAGPPFADTAPTLPTTQGVRRPEHAQERVNLAASPRPEVAWVAASKRVAGPALMHGGTRGPTQQPGLSSSVSAARTFVPSVIHHRCPLDRGDLVARLLPRPVPGGILSPGPGLSCCCVTVVEERSTVDSPTSGDVNHARDFRFPPLCYFPLRPGRNSFPVGQEPGCWILAPTHAIRRGVSRDRLKPDLIELRARACRASSSLLGEYPRARLRLAIRHDFRHHGLREQSPSFLPSSFRLPAG